VPQPGAELVAAPSFVPVGALPDDASSPDGLVESSPDATLPEPPLFACVPLEPSEPEELPLPVCCIGVESLPPGLEHAQSAMRATALTVRRYVIGCRELARRSGRSTCALRSKYYPGRLSGPRLNHWRPRTHLAVRAPVNNFVRAVSRRSVPSCAAAGRRRSSRGALDARIERRNTVRARTFDPTRQMMRCAAPRRATRARSLEGLLPYISRPNERPSLDSRPVPDLT
jgi:hypothetical protein